MLDGLLYKLYSLGVHGYLLKISTSFSTNRCITLAINDHKTQELQCGIGVSQGSVLSPLFFAIYMHNILAGISGHSLQYAGNTTILIAASTDEPPQDACQNSGNKLYIWLRLWRLSANKSKSDFVSFDNACQSPKLSGLPISLSTESSVLGVIICINLRFRLN